jgi:hypothetical protein
MGEKQETTLHMFPRSITRRPLKLVFYCEEEGRKQGVFSFAWVARGTGYFFNENKRADCAVISPELSSPALAREAAFAARMQWLSTGPCDGAVRIARSSTVDMQPSSLPRPLMAFKREAVVVGRKPRQAHW